MPDSMRFVLLFAVRRAMESRMQCFDMIQPQRTKKIQLCKEQSPIGGRILDEKGKPAAGVSVHLRDINMGESNRFPNNPGVDIQAWPATVTTDEQGRFAFHNIGRDVPLPLSMEVEVDVPSTLKTRYFTADPNASRDVEVTIQPIIQGVVICEDTGKPLAGETFI